MYTYRLVNLNNQQKNYANVSVVRKLHATVILHIHIHTLKYVRMYAYLTWYYKSNPIASDSFGAVAKIL